MLMTILDYAYDWSAMSRDERRERCDALDWERRMETRVHGTDDGRTCFDWDSPVKMTILSNGTENNNARFKSWA